MPYGADDLLAWCGYTWPLGAWLFALSLLTAAVSILALAGQRRSRDPCLSIGRGYGEGVSVNGHVVYCFNIFTGLGCGGCPRLPVWLSIFALFGGCCRHFCLFL